MSYSASWHSVPTFAFLRQNCMFIDDDIAEQLRRVLGFTVNRHYRSDIHVPQIRHADNMVGSNDLKFACDEYPRRLAQGIVLRAALDGPLFGDHLRRAWSPMNCRKEHVESGECASNAVKEEFWAVAQTKCNELAGVFRSLPDSLYGLLVDAQPRFEFEELRRVLKLEAFPDGFQAAVNKLPDRFIPSTDPSWETIDPKLDLGKSLVHLIESCVDDFCSLALKRIWLQWSSAAFNAV